MGNCLRHHESSMQWGGEADWGSPAKDQGRRLCARNKRGDKMGGKAMEMEDEGLDLGHGRVIINSSSSATTTAKSTNPTTEVKIKITRKQLEELLGRVDVKELSVHQILAQLMNVSDRYETHQRSWRPALQSIPENY